MSAAQKDKMMIACWQGRVGEVEQLLKEAPSLLNASLTGVFFFFFFFFVFCFLFFVFCFLFFVFLFFVFVSSFFCLLEVV